MEQQHNTWDSPMGRPLRRNRPRADFEYGEYAEFPVTYTPQRSGIFNLYLNGPINDTSQFIGHMEAFQAATENDTVNVFLTTPGGSMDATDTFLQAMHECEGDVIVRASGGVHSCGSMILLHAAKFTLSENFNSLIHNGSTGGAGDLNKYAAAAKHSIEYMNRVLRQTYEGFLTPDELTSMIDGKDFWLDGPEWMRRWHNRQEFFVAKLQASGQLAQLFEEEPELVIEAAAPRRAKKRPRQPQP